MSKKIDKLTPAQEAAMPLYVEKWTKIGLSTEPTNRERAAKNVKDYYTVVNLQAPLVTVFGTSPLASQILGSLLSSNEYIDYVLTAKEPIKFTVDSLRPLVKLDDPATIDRFLTTVATTAVNAAKELSIALNIHPGKTKKPKLSLSWQTICGGNLWAGWQAFYDFFKTEVGVTGLDIINPTIALSQDVGWILPYEKLVILTEKPNTLTVNGEGRLHKDGAAAISWSDGYEIYMLNGTEVPRYMAITPAANLDPKQVLSEANVEVRLQGVKKVGPAKLIEALGAKVIGTQSMAAGGEYELLSVDWTGSERRYLRMINPSTGETCIEPVHPECANVEQALGFRMEALIGNAWNNKQYTYTVPKIYT